jgi:hypothetical protein
VRLVLGIFFSLLLVLLPLKKNSSEMEPKLIGESLIKEEKN